MLVASGVGLVLVISQEGEAFLDDIFQRRRLNSRCYGSWRSNFLHCSHVMRGTAAPKEGTFVSFNGNAIQRDRFFDRFAANWHSTFLPCKAQHEHVAGDRVAEQRRRQSRSFDKVSARIACPVGNRAFKFRQWE